MTGNGNSNLSAHISSLKLIVFDAQGKLVVQKSQSTGAADFGKFTESLRDGKYTAYFIGGPGDSNTDLATFSISNLLPDKDTFVKKLEFSVSEQDQAINVALDRFGAKIKIQLTEAFPADVTSLKFQVRLLNKLGFATLAAESTQPAVGMDYEFNPTVRTKEATLELFCALFPGQTYTVTGVLKAYDKDNKIVYSREIKDIKLENNKLTTVTGNAFHNYTEGFTISINSDYNGNINQNF